MNPNITVQPIHFEDFDGRNFERLVMAYLVNKFPDSTFKWLGRSGKDKGRDIWGLSKNKVTSCFQCTVSSLTKAKAFNDIDKICNLKVAPNKIIFISGGNISADLREKIENYAKSNGIEFCECWQGNEFEEFLRKDFEFLLKRFIGGEIFPDNPKELRNFIKEYNPNPILKEELLITNLVRIKHIPNKIYYATVISDGGTIFKDFTNPPPFILYSSKLYNFREFNNSNLLQKYIDQTTIDTKEIKITNLDSESKRILIRLLNSWLRWVAFNCNLKRDDRTYRYFYPSPEGRTITKIWSGEDRKSRRKIVIRLEKDGILRVIAHKAIKLRIYLLDEKLFIIIIPEWIFTKDGINPLSGEDHNKWERKFRKSKMTYNASYRRNILFWYEMLFSAYEYPYPKGLEKWILLRKRDPFKVYVDKPFKIKSRFGINEKELKQYREEYFINVHKKEI